MNQENNGKYGRIAAIFAGGALAGAVLAALLVNISSRKQEAQESYLKLANLTEETTDPAVWGAIFPRQYDSYKRTVEPTHTNYGGGDTLVAEKADREPWLTRMFAGYAFSLDYRDRRGHAFMLMDQEKTRRVTEKPQPGACLHCHSSIIPAYRATGLKSGATPEEAVMKGFEVVNGMKYKEAHELTGPDGKKMIQHPVSCVDCHDPKTMELRVTRPGFLVGIKALKEHQGVPNYDVNKMASRQEMRTFVCAQCHVEYYFKGEHKQLTYPWANGTRVEEIEKYYDDVKFTDWKHAETGAPVLKAQHPEFEMWSQGVHARSGVSCADCHMPYQREGALKVSDHWVRSPLLNINRACQQCHHYPESEIRARVDLIQSRNHELMERSAQALISFLDSVKKVRGSMDDARWMAFVAKNPDLARALELHKKAQWRLDFVAAENSMGFHAPQEAARILGESIDYFRQAEILVGKVK